MLKDVAARCLAKCKSGTGTLQQANSMAKTCNTLVEFIVNDIKKDVESLQMPCHKSDAQCSAACNILEKLQHYSRPFDGLESEYSFKKYLEGKGFYIAPTSYVIGISHESVLDRQTGYMKTNVNEAQGQYISITQMIEALHANTNLIHQVLHADMNPASGESLHSFFDGLFFGKTML